MKQTVALLLALFLTLFSCTALAHTSAIRQDGQFALQFSDFSSTETHAMQLKKDDILDILASCEQGRLSVTVKYENGAVLYYGADAVPASAAGPIPRDGIYRISVTGERATGSVIVSRNMITRVEPQENAALYARQQGSFGYHLAYEQGLFAFEPIYGADRFYTLPAAGGLAPAELVLSRVPASLDAAALSLLTADGASEGPASMINWHAARTVRVVTGEDPLSPVIVHTLIELNNGELLTCQARYALGDEETLGTKLLQMVESLQFFY